MTDVIREDFSGAGGCSEGKRLAGVTADRVIGIEANQAAAATAVAAGHERVVADVRSDFIRGSRAWANLVGYTAGPPCQTFSMAGNGTGRRALGSLILAADKVALGMLPEDAMAAVHDDELDERSLLVLEPMLVIGRHRPGWVLLEQVPAVLPIWERLAEILAERFDYHVTTAILNAEQYGVPQTRRRAILAARLDRDVAMPTPTHSRFYTRDRSRLDPGVAKWVSMAEALGWGMTERPSMTVMGGGTATGGPEPFGNGARNGMRRELADGRWMQRSNYSAGGRPGQTAAERGLATRPVDEPSFAITSKGFHWVPDEMGDVQWRMAGAGATAEQTSGQRPRGLDEPAHTVTGKGTAAWVYRNGNQEHAARRPLEEPAPTVHFGGRSNKVEWMEADRAHDVSASGIRVTVQEAAILQTFRPDYPWQGTKSEQYQQVGNAVPPLLSAAVLKELTR